MFHRVDPRSQSKKEPAASSSKPHESGNSAARASHGAVPRLQSPAPQYPSFKVPATMPQQAKLKNEPVAEIMQQKALTAGVLNVVGENHDLSDPMIPWEREYTTEKTGGTYWGENEFQIPSTHEDDQSPTVEYGDPKSYQMAHWVHFSMHPFIAIKSTLTNLSKSGVASGTNRIIPKGALLTSYRVLPDYLESARASESLFWRLKSESEEEIAHTGKHAEIMETYGQFGELMYGTFLGEMEAWMAEVQPLTTPEAQVSYDAINHFIGASVGLLGQCTSNMALVFEDAPQTFDSNRGGINQVMYVRSETMHNAANVGKAKNGVWKIGNTHLKEIKEDISPNSPITYEIMTEGEFLDDFNPWLAHNLDYQRSLDMEAMN